ncbi:hypothetical protein KP509_29G051800 [Ceratopteris richardii]|uniref:Nonsense-mediated mRNA decay factor SMG8 n=1 Tax=Ceratopteris richardii TaxID=49495 RepID=A0A8T2R6Y8_CERRI|nr:hypothetical protein KP509_29G051800 [Ceratopteris richardii]
MYIAWPSIYVFSKHDCLQHSVLSRIVCFVKRFLSIEFALFVGRDLQVCHLILFLQEGSRVDTHLLRTLRILQNAKHLLVPFVKSHVLSGLHLTSFTLEQSSSSTRSSSHSAGQSSGRGGTSGRNASTIGLMSGSAPSFFPGQCTPVLLFVFLEDFCDANQGSNAFSNGEDKTDLANTQLSTVSCQPGGPIIGSRQAVHLKGSNAVVMLARATNRTEGGLRKKLQSSLESQIRYLVKKCKVLGGLADGVGFGMGSRGPGHSMGSTSGALGGSSLFVLDTMRAACLLDKSPNLQCDALKAAMNVINENLKGKGEAEKINLLDLSGNASEDVQALRDFIWKQVDILRGRGGVLTNSTGGSMGVGMVAAAAAAAAASAAAGGFGGSAGSMKPLSNPPELPSISNWLSACRILLDALLTGEGQQLKDLKKFQPGRVAGSSRRGSAESGNVNIHGKEALGFALGCLSSASDFDLKFSEEWCKRMFPSVVAMYTNSLPPCYPTIIHQSHLEKALHYLKAMVKGPAVDLFAAKLKAECEGIWKPGRQLCDAVSLTGRPCIHKVHDLPSGSITDMDEAKTSKETGRSEGQNELSSSHPKPHSSGVVFLHACACGRSRRLREDPFDFEIANVKFFHFPVCEDLLPSMVIPDCESNKPLGGSAWGLVRLGSSNYYQQSAGLLQTGFSHDKRFLSLWNISYAVEFSKHEVNAISDETTRMNQNLPLYDVPRSLRGTLSFLDVLERRGSKLQSGNVGGVPQGAVEKDERLLAKSALGERRETQMARPSMASDEKRLFKDVVARNASDFPPLQQKRAIQRNVKTVIEKKFHDESEQVLAGIKEIKELSLKDKEQISLGTGAVKAAAFGEREFGKIGIKNLSVYVGLEHECPRGHRFLVSADQIEALGSIGLSEENLTVSQNKVRGAMDNLRKTRHGQEFPVNSSCTWVNQEQASNHLGNAQWNMSSSDGVLCKIVNEGSGDGYRLLNMNIPIYMMCPCCAKSTDKKKKNAPNFAGNISQLQRIFLVTPPLPLLISTCPSVQFNEACDNHIDLKGGVGSTIFSLGCDVVLPPESFVVLRLPFVYYMEHIDGSKYPLNCNKQQPEKTAWLLKSTAFKIMSRS